MEKLVMTTFSREDLNDIFKECLKEEIGKIKVMPESQNYPVTHLSVKMIEKQYLHLRRARKNLPVK